MRSLEQRDERASEIERFSDKKKKVGGRNQISRIEWKKEKEEKEEEDGGEMLRVLTLSLLLLFISNNQVFGFLEEAEGVIPKDRTCDPDEERAAQSCKNGVTVLSATFESIQGQHESFTASDHIGINQNCKTSLTCLKNYIGCSEITEEDVDILTKKCKYMTYLTGGFYACSQKLKERKEKSACVQNFFDAVAEPVDKPCGEWSKNRACLKWTIRDACGRSYWKQYKPYWHLKYSLMKCE